MEKSLILFSFPPVLYNERLIWQHRDHYIRSFQQMPLFKVTLVQKKKKKKKKNNIYIYICVCVYENVFEINL